MRMPACLALSYVNLKQEININIGSVETLIAPTQDAKIDGWLRR